ncbi:Uncharacterised protein [Mycobacteroides abscessus subsp. abscessus]|nr:Uncharacterised protein [Mycobacteroides abscessus subsp. abscessus]
MRCSGTTSRNTDNIDGTKCTDVARVAPINSARYNGSP